MLGAHHQHVSSELVRQRDDLIRRFALADNAFDGTLARHAGGHPLGQIIDGVCGVLLTDVQQGYARLKAAGYPCDPRKGAPRSTRVVHGTEHVAQAQRFARRKRIASHGEHRDSALTKNALGNRAHHEPVHTAAAVRAHHNKAGLQLSGDRPYAIHWQSFHHGGLDSYGFSTERVIDERAQLRCGLGVPPAELFLSSANSAAST